MKKLFILTPLALLLLLSGCSIGTDTGGTLVLSLTDRVSARTIQPALDMNPATWDVEGTGPEGAAFTQTGLTSTTVVQKSLVPGQWLIEVTARNALGEAIGYGSAAITVAAGEVTLVSVTVLPLVGAGTLDVRVTWPDGVLTTPVLSAELAPSAAPFAPSGGRYAPSGEPFTPLALSVGPNWASHLGDHANGYYTLRLLLRDQGNVVWGTVEAVRIIAGETSSALFALTNDVNFGGLGLEIVTDLQNPITVTLSGPDSLARGHSMTVSAATSVAVDGYQWYLQGAPIGTNANSVVLGSGLALGHYWLSLVVTKGSVLSSASMEFDVVPALIRNYLFTVNVRSGTYAGAVYSGSFSVDVSDLTGSGPETLTSALTDFHYNPFGGSYGPISGVGSAIFVNGALDKIELVDSASGRGWGFNSGFYSSQVPDDIEGGRWWGYLNPATYVDGFGTYILSEVME